METLQKAINTNDINLLKQAIKEGIKPESLFLHSIKKLNNKNILELLIKNGFDINNDTNNIINHWMGGWRDIRPTKVKLLAFISEYYLEKPKEISLFTTTILQKSLLFRIGLDNNDKNIMKFALKIGANQNEALSYALNRYYKKDDNKKDKKTNYYIIKYILNSNIKFDEITISNAVFFKYTDVLDALSNITDLEYGYEMAYKYEDISLCEYFNSRGVSHKIQNFIKMKISAIKGDIKGLRKAVNDGANIKELDKEIIIEIINNNQIEILKYLLDSGLVFEPYLEQCLNKALNIYDAYETVSYLIEQGLDITNVKNIPKEYKEKYPTIAHMWEKKFTDIFDYTVYLASEFHPKLEGKEKDEILQRIAYLSTLPYVIKCSQGKTND